VRRFAGADRSPNSTLASLTGPKKKSSKIFYLWVGTAGAPKLWTAEAERRRDTALQGASPSAHFKRAGHYLVLGATESEGQQLRNYSMSENPLVSHQS